MPHRNRTVLNEGLAELEHIIPELDPSEQVTLSGILVSSLLQLNGLNGSGLGSLGTRVYRVDWRSTFVNDVSKEKHMTDNKDTYRADDELHRLIQSLDTFFVPMHDPIPNVLTDIEVRFLSRVQASFLRYKDAQECVRKCHLVQCLRSTKWEDCDLETLEAVYAVA